MAKAKAKKNSIKSDSKKVEPKASKQVVKKSHFIGAIIAVALLAFGVSYFVTSGSSNNKITYNPDAPCPADQCVALTPNGPDPGELYVTKGQSVQFNSADGKSHQLALGEDDSEHHSSDRGKYESQEFKSDEAFNVRFDQTGTYYFVDKKNPETKVLVVVYDTKVKNKF